MSAKDDLTKLIQVLPEQRLQEVLDFARYLAAREDDDDASWREFGLQQLARAYGDDEPEYTLNDILPEKGR